MKKLVTAVLIGVFSIMLAACGNAAENAAPAEAIKPTIIPPATATPALGVTATPEPTMTPVPTAEPAATATPKPTATTKPKATATPKPTATPVPEAKDTYAKGKLTDTGYESKWLGIRFKAPKGVTMITQEDMDDMMQLGLDALYGDNEEAAEDYMASPGGYEMVAAWDGGSSVQLMVEKLPEGITELDYLSALEEVLALIFGDAFSSDENLYIVELGGKEFVCLSTYTDIGDGYSYYQDYCVMEKDGRIVGIIFTYGDDDEKFVEEAAKAFAPY